MAIKNLIKHIRKEDMNWMVSVEPIPYSLNVKVWLLKKEGENIFTCIVEKGFLTMEKIDKSKEPSPLLIVPEDAWRLVVSAILESVEGEVRKSSDAEMDAVKYHLEDMRKLVFTETVVREVKND